LELYLFRSSTPSLALWPGKSFPRAPNHPSLE
jgi:hypothetical protein